MIQTLQIKCKLTSETVMFGFPGWLQTDCYVGVTLQHVNTHHVT